MSVVNSINDGVIPKEPFETDKETEQEPTELTPSETDRESEEGNDDKSEEESESEETSNIRVKAVIGVVKLLLHSSAGELARISVEGWTVCGQYMCWYLLTCVGTYSVVNTCVGTLQVYIYIPASSFSKLARLHL